MNDWQHQLKKSSLVFNQYFKNLILEIFNGDFEVVEGVTKYEMAKTLDQLAGIDLWYFNPKYGIRGVASRIQFGNKNWRTFTVRKNRESQVSTEYEKRSQAIKKEWLYPILTIQGYFNEQNNTVLGFAIAKTTDILWMIDNGYYYLRKTGIEQIGQAEFYVVKWDEMKGKNLNITIYKEYSGNKKKMVGQIGKSSS